MSGRKVLPNTCGAAGEIRAPMHGILDHLSHSYWEALLPYWSPPMSGRKVLPNTCGAAGEIRAPCAKSANCAELAGFLGQNTPP